MDLHLLCHTPVVRVYEDRTNDWLYVEWEGALLLPVVQHACLEVARCFLEHLYPRVLNSNMLVTHIDREVGPWLAQNLLPSLELAGVEHLAWVYAASTPGLNLVEQATGRLSLLQVAAFADVEEAVSWLQRTQPEPPESGCALGRLPADEQKLTHLVGKLDQLVQGPAAVKS